MAQTKEQRKKEYQRKWYHLNKERLQQRKHPCKDCGTLVTSRSTRCRSCATKERWEKGEMPFVIGKLGDKNYHWKGGRFKSGGGYIFILKKGYYRANSEGYVQEHIFVWEEANKKSLPKGWHIHHLNGMKDDNRLSNLMALPSKKHYLILAAKAKRIQELEALLNNQHQLL